MLERRLSVALIAMSLSAAALSAQPTFSKEVSRILQQNCQQCHRPNDIAPFSLLSYDDASSQARRIVSAVTSRVMPPWKPVAGHGEFKNPRLLSDDDIQTIRDWYEAGMPEGDPADLPPPTEFSAEWRLGVPDQTISMPEPYTPVAREDRPDRYRCFVVRNVVDQDRWVKAVDILPGARQLVHHVLLYLTDQPSVVASIAKMEAEDPEPGYDCWGGPRFTPAAGPGLIKELGGVLGGWAPGAQPAVLQPEMGLMVPKGATLVIQVHYNLENLGDEVVQDQTRVGLYFQPATPKLRVLTLPIVNTTFKLPPGAMNQDVIAEFPFDLGQALGIPIPDAWVPKFSAVAVAPHMHQLGTKFDAEVKQPDGTVTPLIRIDDWDFHWQGFYDYAKPVPIPYRSKISAKCTFDNTTDRTITWGESTTDEMCLLYVGFIAEGGLGSLFGNPQ